MEDMGVTAGFWRDKRVLLTGHTGFKGSWLALWLQTMGAHVTGYSLDPLPGPSLFVLANIAEGLEDLRGDLRMADSLMSVVANARPQIVLHLAAQPLVHEGYSDPAGTYATNVMGTLHLLEAIRRVGGVRSCVLVTTDKVYANQEWSWPYRENEPLGGHDPYSSSKACCELLAQSYVASFFAPHRYAQHNFALATARAGNVVGGGDFAVHRLIPDTLKAWSEARPVLLRAPDAVRPWQHVLEPLAGYLQLAEALYARGPERAGAWNFGPRDEDMCSVGEVVRRLGDSWGTSPGQQVEPGDLHEARLLRLDSSRARDLLGWRPRWSLDECLLQTLAWDRSWRAGENMRQVTLEQLRRFKAAC